MLLIDVYFFFFFKQKTAYEMRISDWSSDVCSSDLVKIDGPCDYQTLIRLTVKTERRERVVAGTLFGGTRARVVQVQDIHFEAEVGRRMLFVRNRDKPGFIGKLGSILGGAGVNIANFHLDRKSTRLNSRH